MPTPTHLYIPLPSKLRFRTLDLIPGGVWRADETILTCGVGRSPSEETQLRVSGSEEGVRQETQFFLQVFQRKSFCQRTEPHSAECCAFCVAWQALPAGQPRSTAWHFPFSLPHLHCPGRGPKWREEEERETYYHHKRNNPGNSNKLVLIWT